jgi:hypothetical protein
LQQYAGALDIGHDEPCRTVDRAVDMRSRGEVEDRIGIEFPQELVHSPIADIRLTKGIARMVFDGPGLAA